MDRISNLSEGVTLKILSGLSLRDAVRTSVLSSDWRYKPAMLPKLVFDDRCTPTEHYTFAGIVDHVLMGHIGNIHTFKLDRENLSFRDIDRWILHLSRNSVKEFILEKPCGDYRPYLLPACMFACQDLIQLNLRNCLLQPQPTFKGFRSLVALRLENVTLNQKVLENLTCCSLLERLILINCVGFQQLKIHAPNLQYLLFYGDFEDINILNTLNLVGAMIILSVQRNGCCRSTNLLKFFANLPHIQRLHINNNLTKYLGIDSSLEKLPRPCLHLETLMLAVCYNDPKDILFALCLLKSSPALKELDILAVGLYHYQADAGKVNSWVDENQRCRFTQLRHVIMTDFPPVRPALDFVKFLLSSSPALETINLFQNKSEPSHVYSDLRGMLLQLPRASVNLEIILHDK